MNPSTDSEPCAEKITSSHKSPSFVSFKLQDSLDAPAVSDPPSQEHWLWTYGCWDPCYLPQHGWDVWTTTGEFLPENYCIYVYVYIYIYIERESVFFSPHEWWVHPQTWGFAREQCKTRYCPMLKDIVVLPFQKNSRNDCRYFCTTMFLQNRFCAQPFNKG